MRARGSKGDTMNTSLNAYDIEGDRLNVGAVIALDGTTFVAAIEADRGGNGGVIRIHRECWPEGVTEDQFAVQYEITVR
jgi:hypothetical protein